MTNYEHTDEHTDEPVPADLAIVAAFLDGEEVDGGALKASLANEDARDYLVDLLLLRRSVAYMGPMTIGRTSGGRRRTTGRWLVAAAIFMATAIGGYAAGALSVPDVHARSSIEVSTEATISPPPKPTEVIRLQPGINWQQGRD
jgi:hypothetical protein